MARRMTLAMDNVRPRPIYLTVDREAAVKIMEALELAGHEALAASTERAIEHWDEEQERQRRYAERER